MVQMDAGFYRQNEVFSVNTSEILLSSVTWISNSMVQGFLGQSTVAYFIKKVILKTNLISFISNSTI
jgi:hypothetical protein